MGPKMKRLGVLGFVVALVVVAAVMVARSKEDPGVGAPGAATDLPADPEIRASLHRQMMEQRDALPSELSGSYVLLPVDQRKPWIDAWNGLRECTRRHGYQGVGPVAPTYGDGRTPMPKMDLSAAGAAEALRDCPFDTSALDEDRIRAAVEAAQGGK